MRDIMVTELLLLFTDRKHNSWRQMMPKWVQDICVTWVHVQYFEFLVLNLFSVFVHVISIYVPPPQVGECSTYKQRMEHLIEINSWLFQAFLLEAAVSELLKLIMCDIFICFVMFFFPPQRTRIPKYNKYVSLSLSWNRCLAKMHVEIVLF